MRYLIFLLALTSAPAIASDCMLPFERMTSSVTGTNFSTNDIYNDYANVKDMYRQRYIVLNLDSAESGMCKGISEHYPSNGELPTNVFPELAEANGLATYQNSVLKWYEKPSQKKRVALGNCIGQTVTLCEVRNNEVHEIAKLAVSARDGSAPPYMIGRDSYYSELNVINTRRWAVNRDAYTAQDAARDREMGGNSPYSLADSETRSYNGWVMPNFINFIAAPGYYGNPQNGLHELSRGETNVNNLGAPVSHGCIRLTKYGSILMRWWLPRGARMFIHYTPEGYKKWAAADGTPR